MADEIMQIAMDAQRGVLQREQQFTSYVGPMAERRESTERSQLVHGGTEEYVKYLDYISQSDICYEAPYETATTGMKIQLFMKGVDCNKQAGPLCQRPDYKTSANAV